MEIDYKLDGKKCLTECPNAIMNDNEVVKVASYYCVRVCDYFIEKNLELQRIKCGFKK